MTERLIHVLRVYLSRRWVGPIIGLAVIVWGLLVFAQSRVDNLKPSLLVNCLGLPIMGVAFWVTNTAKWQFVNPRARMLPGFAGPHLAVIVAWFVLGLCAMPVFVGFVVPSIQPIASLAYGLISGAILVWAMHTGRPLISLIGMGVLFSPVISVFRPLWFGDGTFNLAVAQLIVAGAGAVGIVWWLVELVGLTEESDAYIIPTQAQSGKASRMEKSEARRNVALQLSRSKLASRLVDWWVDSVEGRQATTPSERQSLLSFGHSSVPPWARCMWLITLMIGVATLNVLLVKPSRGGALAIAGPTLLMFTVMAPAVATQLLAMRRARMQTEILWPLTRQQYVNGLFRLIVMESIQVWSISVGVCGLMVAVLAPELLRGDWVVGVVLAALSSLIAVTGISLHAALIDSGLRRSVTLLAGIYVVGGVMIGSGVLYKQGYVMTAYVMGLSVLAAGVATSYSARRRWLEAELG